MDAEDSGFSRDHIRVSDADRDQAVGELSEHFQTGRLTQDEFEERSGRALAARTGYDLGELFTDLPRRPVVPDRGFAAAAPVAADDRMAPVDHYHHRPTARLIVALVLVAIIVSNIFDQAQGGFGWLIPVLILGLIFLRGGRHHHRH